MAKLPTLSWLPPKCGTCGIAGERETKIAMLQRVDSKVTWAERIEVFLTIEVISFSSSLFPDISEREDH